MDCNTFSALFDFRQDLYACFLKASDVLMNTADALLSQTDAQSLVELTLSPYFQRRWSSLYDAFENAKIDREALRKLLMGTLPRVPVGHRRVFGVDASSIPRPLSPTARDRSYVHASHLPEGSKPVLPGWQFSTITLLPEEPSSWTFPVDNLRIQSDQTQGEVASTQLTQLAPLLFEDDLLLGDGYYGSAAFVALTTGIPCDLLLRFAKNRVLFGPAPPKTGKPGAPRKDGAAFKCSDPATQGTPEGFWEGEDKNGHKLQVACWHNLHFKKARQVTVSVIRVTRSGAADTKRDPRVSWFLFVGKAMPALCEIPATYARRYSLEHGYRFDKQDLLWEKAHLRSPEQFQHWTDIVACVHVQLVLARDLVSERRPWERTVRPVTPQQVRRAMGVILDRLGTPARVCRVRGKSPGRPLGTLVEKAPRYKVVFKATEKTKKAATKV
jgi:DDE superfamily endonuclease